MTQQWTEAPLSGFEELAPEPKPAIGEAVHPFAALFPMMADDDLADLAADIQANGLIHPLIVDTDGQLIDGRNRKAACERAGVAPRYETLAVGIDPVAFILGANVHRRHMSQGAKAMAVILGAKLSNVGQFEHGRRQALAQTTQVHGSRLSEALTVATWAEELAPAVMHGARLDEAYAVAVQRKQDAEFQARELDRLEREHPALALQVNSGELTLSQARAMAQAQARTKAEEAEVARLQQQIALAREEVGDTIPLPARREIAVEFAAQPAPDFARNSTAEADALRREHEFLQRLIGLKRAAEQLAAEPVLRELSWREGHLNAVRSAAAQTLTALYALVDAHEAALVNGPAIRKVK